MSQTGCRSAEASSILYSSAPPLPPPPPTPPEPFFPISPLVCLDRAGLRALRGTFLHAFNDKTDKLSLCPLAALLPPPLQLTSSPPLPPFLPPHPPPPPQPLPRAAVARSEDCRLVADSQGRTAGSALPAGTRGGAEMEGGCAQLFNPTINQHLWLLSADRELTQ